MFLIGRVLLAQTGNTQTVRGTILDLDSRQPLFGAAVTVLGSDPPLGATTDMDGRFTITGVPTGRIDLRIRAMGFEEQLMPNLLVNSGKELVLNVQMQSSVTKMEEVTVSAAKPKGEARNDMATLSSHRISVEETSRIAGGINDPARMVGTF
ncbi:MAG TPA: carboxypeptidase-like regulatory domain-containing protein, partial [Flavobacteriales bacterium]|nr:carboxypeptidase-like regulatory domain-containing protein [Flavobacteriales bacterium]